MIEWIISMIMKALFNVTSRGVRKILVSLSAIHLEILVATTIGSPLDAIYEV